MDIITQPLVYLLKFSYSLTHSWGLAIVLGTFFVKMILFPLSIKQYQSMDKMKKIQPMQKELQEKYKNNPEEYQKKVFELYKKENANPFSGCLPMLIQLPVFIGFYWILSDPKFGIISLMKDSSFLWFNLHDKNDLIIAFLSAITTFWQQKISTVSTNAEQNQQFLLYIMPVFLGYITWTFNTALGLYWVTSNVVSIAQQYFINEFFIVKEKREEQEEKQENKKYVKTTEILEKK